MLRAKRLRTLPMLVLIITSLGTSHQAWSQTVPNGATGRIEVTADDMCCKGCAQKVAAQLYALPGVTTVEADVPNRLVVITAKPSQKLTLGRIWDAVEKGKGGPSKIATSHVTYTLTRSDKLKPEQRLPVGRYSLMVRGIEDQDVVQRIATQLYRIRGVNKVGIDRATRALVVECSNETVISPWALATAVEQARDQTLAIGGPFGWFRIETAAEAGAPTAARSVYSRSIGEVR